MKRNHDPGCLTSVWECTRQRLPAFRSLAFLWGILLMAASPAFGEVVAEGFDINPHGQNPPTFYVLGKATSAAAQETVQRAAASNFAWGAYCQPGSNLNPAAATGGGTQPQRWIALANRYLTSSLVFDAGCFVRGNYAYTRFDSDASDGNANVPNRRIDISSDNAHVSLSVYANARDCQIAILLRDGNTWWCSQEMTIRAYPFGNGYNIERRDMVVPNALSWFRLEGTAGMDLVNGAAGPVTIGAGGMPDLTSVEGMGILCRSGEPGNLNNELYISGLALSDNRTERPKLTVPLKNSDVAFLHLASPIEKFEECGGAKIVYWGAGWSPARNKLAAEAGLRYMPVVSMGSFRDSLLAIYPNNPDAPDAVAQDFWGRKVFAQNATYLNNRIARMCIRKPATRQYMKDYLRDRVYSIGAREALFDEPAGANGNTMLLHQGGGCFCDLCNDGFREYLKDNGFTNQMLIDAGIPVAFADIDTFDYRAYVQSLFPDTPWYAKGSSEPRTQLAGWWRAFTNSTDGDWGDNHIVKNDLPLIRHFIKYQQIPAIGAFRELRDFAESLDKDFLVSANTFNMNSHVLYTLEEVTAEFVGAEMQLQAYNVNSMPKNLIRLRIAEALGKRVVTPGIHWEWEQTRAKGLKNNVKIAIAATYASGHILSPPDFYDWVSPHYYGNMADYGPYYRFIREHPALFDGYRTLSQIGVLYNCDPLVSSNANHDTAFAGDKAFISDFNEIASRLFNNYFPVGVVCAGDGTFVTKEFTEEEIKSRFEYVVEPRNTALTGSQAAIVEKLRSQGKVYSWAGEGQTDVNKLKSRIAPWIKCSGQQVNYIWAMPRTRNPLARKTDPDLIVHLVNGKHSTNTDVVTPNRNFNLEIGRELLAGRTPQRILCYEVPKPEPRTLTCTETDTGIKIVVPELYIWNIIQFEFGDATNERGVGAVIGPSSLRR